MKLQVEELSGSTLVHTATANRRISIKAVRPFLYKHRSPSGTFTITIKQNSNTLQSKSFTSAQMESDVSGITPSNFFHGTYKLEFDTPAIVNRGEFTIELSSSGYSFSESAYIGWVREHERIVNDFTAVATTDLNPLAVEVWEFKRI